MNAQDERAAQLKAMRDYVQHLVGVLEVLGREHVLDARAEALMKKQRTSVEYVGKLLGGKLRITVEFDGRENWFEQ